MSGSARNKKTGSTGGKNQHAWATSDSLLPFLGVQVTLSVPVSCRAFVNLLCQFPDTYPFPSGNSVLSSRRPGATYSTPLYGMGIAK